ncbi:hypothetical protein BBB56_19700 [Candidatus Pantoea deserta]|uniref:Uncharacterized protein n=1 Tax=Candidatus Pantoea deserta TaxID=1869313 RepID=A0A3N4NIC9_9GAMM|nr:hypothetical protein [Pantoea deserta]RPD96114.1 hypothetical protein BBB56_19700 [Pantoea deserta]
MKFIFFLFTFTASPAVLAAQMQGFGASYYQDVLPDSYYDTNISLVPEVTVGDRLYAMESSRLSDIAKTAGVMVNKDDRASWLCLASQDISYWFISDNEMGHGDLTAIAIARTRQHKECSSFKGKLSVSVRGILLPEASREKILSSFSHKPTGDIIQYCHDTRRDGEFTQMNCLQYFLEGNHVKGLLISQLTSS